jgi:hypothetical protein
MLSHVKGKRRRQLFAEMRACPPRRPWLFSFAVVALLWVLYTWATCGSDGDCWLGERVRMVTESKLSDNYDPDEAGNKILIYDFAGVRTLKFGSLSHVRQASAILGDANKFTMPIACHLAAAVLVLCAQPPKRVLIFGMGGGNARKVILPWSVPGGRACELAYVFLCVFVCARENYEHVRSACMHLLRYARSFPC